MTSLHPAFSPAAKKFDLFCWRMLGRDHSSCPVVLFYPGRAEEVNAALFLSHPLDYHPLSAIRQRE